MDKKISDLNMIMFFISINNIHILLLDTNKIASWMALYQIKNKFFSVCAYLQG